MPAFSQRVMSELKPELKALRAELGRVNDLLADVRAREVAATLAKFREDVALLGITEQEVRRALGYDRPARLTARSPVRAWQCGDLHMSFRIIVLQVVSRSVEHHGSAFR
jgi:hypothetical protein